MARSDDWLTKPTGYIGGCFWWESKEEMRHKEEMQRLKNEELRLRQGLPGREVVDIDAIEDVTPKKLKLLPRTILKQIEHYE